MNVRFSVGEVRVRMERSEAEALARGEPVVHEVALPGAKFAWRVEPSVTGDPTVELRGTTLVLAVSPAAMAEQLARKPSKDVGISAELPVPGEPPLKLSIEIDVLSGKRR